jgi:hypothetical protein
MMAYGRSQLFELAPGCRLRATLADVSFTGSAIDTSQRGLTEEIEEPS